MSNERRIGGISRKKVFVAWALCAAVVLAFGINAIIVQDAGLFIIVSIFAIIVSGAFLLEGRYTIFSDESVATYSFFGKKLNEVRWSDVKNTLVYRSQPSRGLLYVILITTEDIDFSQVPENNVEWVLCRGFLKKHQTVSLTFTTLKEFEVFKENIPFEIEDVYGNILNLYEKKRRKEEGKNNKN